jgi:hypothetical protein
MKDSLTPRRSHSNIGRHAYLIMAHDNFYVLEKLLLLLDDPRNDIYLHIDAKTVNFDFSRYRDIVKQSGISLPGPRVKVNWSGFTQIEAELLLLKAAAPREYDYYHILSGADLPLKTQDYIHHFFTTYAGKEFVGFGTDTDVALNRVRYIHLFNELGRSHHATITLLARASRKAFVITQKALGYNINENISTQVRKGANWASISHELASYILEHEYWIHKVFKHSIKCDEIFIQTLVCNSHFMERVYDPESEMSSCLRHIDWLRGDPYTFRKHDFDELITSDKLFARKFDAKTDVEIVDMIYEHISKQ